MSAVVLVHRHTRDEEGRDMPWVQRIEFPMDDAESLAHELERMRRGCKRARVPAYRALEVLNEKIEATNEARERAGQNE